MGRSGSGAKVGGSCGCSPGAIRATGRLRSSAGGPGHQEAGCRRPGSARDRGRAGAGGHKGRPTVAALVEQWLERRRETLSLTTYEAYLGKARFRLIPDLGRSPSGS